MQFVTFGYTNGYGVFKGSDVREIRIPHAEFIFTNKVNSLL